MGKVAIHDTAVRANISHFFGSLNIFEEKARLVIFICVVLAGIPRKVKMVRAATLPMSDESAAMLSACVISSPIFLIILFPKNAPDAINAENRRTNIILFFSFMRDADSASAMNF